MTVGPYERELKGILTADEEVIKGATKTCSKKEKSRYKEINNIPFIVVRAAGSLGIDLIAVRGELSFPIEVKSSKEDILYFSRGKLTEQAEDMIDTCTTTRLLPIYAYRLKGQRGDKWRVFSLNVDGLTKKSKVLDRKLPTVEKTDKDNLIMPWENGMPLSEFISYLNHLLS